MLVPFVVAFLSFHELIRPEILPAPNFAVAQTLGASQTPFTGRPHTKKNFHPLRT